MEEVTVWAEVDSDSAPNRSIQPHARNYTRTHLTQPSADREKVDVAQTKLHELPRVPIPIPTNPTPADSRRPVASSERNSGARSGQRERMGSEEAIDNDSETVRVREGQSVIKRIQRQGKETVWEIVDGEEWVPHYSGASANVLPATGSRFQNPASPTNPTAFQRSRGYLRPCSLYSQTLSSGLCALQTQLQRCGESFARSSESARLKRWCCVCSSFLRWHATPSNMARASVDNTDFLEITNTMVELRRC